MKMKITQMEVTIKDLIDGYEGDSEDTGVVAFHGLLNVRPKYQREFVYNEKEQKAVIDTVLKGFPLSIMYWVKNADGTYEMLDGQQRTLSICRFCDGEFSVVWKDNRLACGNIRRTYPELYDQLMNYKLLVFVCEGPKDEQMEWFKTINIAGKELTTQELRNINYTGEWLTAAKRYFSKTRCPATIVGDGYVAGVANRQDILETVLEWISNSEDNICDYMSAHQGDHNANELIAYFETVMNWVKNLFPHYRTEMKGQPWGLLYNEYHKNEYDPDELEEEICELMANENVTKHKAIYPYLFNRDDSALNVRRFTTVQRNRAYARQGGCCAICGEAYPIKKMQADHIIPWSKGGATTDSNCQMLCANCNRDKSSAIEIDFE